MSAGMMNRFFAPVPWSRRYPARSEMETIRAGLRCSTIEAIFATVHLVLSQGIFLTNYVLFLGAPNLVCSLVESLPFLSQFMYFLSPMLVRRLRYRKPVSLFFSVTHRASWIVLIVLLYVDWPVAVKLSLMVLVLLFSNICAVIANNSWFSWMADLVPASLRGSYYGRRNAYLGLTSMITLLVGAKILHWSKQIAIPEAGYTMVFSIAIVSAVFGAFMMARQYEPNSPNVPPMSFRRLIDTVRSYPQMLIFIKFYCIWQFSLGLSSALFGVHMVKELKMSPAEMGLMSFVTSTMALLGSRFWGRAVDQVGDRAILITSGMMVAMHVWCWMPATQDRMWPVWVTAVLGGFSWAGFNIVIFSWPQRLCGNEDRQYTYGLAGFFSGPSFVIGSMCGGLLTTYMPHVLFHIGNYEFLHFHLAFILSSLGRLMAVLLIALWSFKYDRYGRPIVRCFVDSFRAMQV